MLHRFSTLSHKLIQLALPGYCQLCGAESTRQICNDCFIDLPKQLASCSRCDLPFNGLKSVPPIAPETPFDTRPSTFETWCADCQQLSEQQLKEGFDRAITAYTYNRDVSFIVNAFKNQQSPFWADLLLPALLERIDNLQTPPFPEAIVPVPLHWKRYLSRGFNQSVVIRGTTQTPLPNSDTAAPTQTQNLYETAISRHESTSAKFRRCFHTQVQSVAATSHRYC